MGISGNGTHFGEMILSWPIIAMSFAAIFYVLVTQARSSRTMRNAHSNDSQAEKGDE